MNEYCEQEIFAVFFVFLRYTVHNETRNQYDIYSGV